MNHSSGKSIADYLKPGMHAHLVGIGGVSMRPLGLVLRSQGLIISGSDMNASVSTDELLQAMNLALFLHRLWLHRMHHQVFRYSMWIPNQNKVHIDVYLVGALQNILRC